jgi:hypothetical protein
MSLNVQVPVSEYIAAASSRFSRLPPKAYLLGHCWPLYNLGYLCLSPAVYRMYDNVRSIRPFGVECGLYLASLVTFYLIVRGPIILITWFYLFPMVCIALRNPAIWLLRRKHARKPASPRRAGDGASLG